MWSMLMSLFDGTQFKFWATLTVIGFMAGGSCATLHSRFTTHEVQSSIMVKRLTVMCKHQAKTMEQAMECVE